MLVIFSPKKIYALRTSLRAKQANPEQRSYKKLLKRASNLQQAILAMKNYNYGDWSNDLEKDSQVIIR